MPNPLTLGTIVKDGTITPNPLTLGVIVNNGASESVPTHPDSHSQYPVKFSLAVMLYRIPHAVRARAVKFTLWVMFNTSTMKDKETCQIYVVGLDASIIAAQTDNRQNPINHSYNLKYRFGIGLYRFGIERDFWRLDGDCLTV